MAEEEQPVETGQDPAPAPTPVAAPPQRNPGPWDNDLAQAFQDETVRSQVDSFLREKVQPHTTRLEQKAAEAAQAQQLYNDLIENPVGTYEALTNELFDPESAQQLLAVLQGEGAEPQPEQYEEPGEQPVDPRLEALWARQEEQDAAEAYDSEMARITEEHPGLNPDYMHPFVVTAEGDFDQAYELYENFVNQWNEANAEPAEPQAGAPPTLGGDSGATAPPTQPRAGTIGDAVDAFMAANRATNDPPPVA